MHHVQLCSVHILETYMCFPQPEMLAKVFASYFYRRTIYICRHCN